MDNQELLLPWLVCPSSRAKYIVSEALNATSIRYDFDLKCPIKTTVWQMVEPLGKGGQWEKVSSLGRGPWKGFWHPNGFRSCVPATLAIRYCAITGSKQWDHVAAG